MNTKEKTTNYSPTWEECVPMLFTLMERGTTLQSIGAAKDEILRMAKLADKYIAIKELTK